MVIIVKARAGLSAGQSWVACGEELLTDLEQEEEDEED